MSELTRFAFVLAPRFSLLALSGAIEALRAANVACGRHLYQWRLVSPQGGEIEASSGLYLRTGTLDEVEPASRVAICGGERSHDWSPPALIRWLRRRARQGAVLGALSDGSFVMAQAGLFDTVRSTIHWKCLDAYRERFPALDTRASVFELDGRRFSCAGGTAALDLFVTMIQRQHGVKLAIAVADNYLQDRIRDSESTQRLSGFHHLVSRSPPLALAVRRMEENIETPLPIAAIAEAVDVSPRHLDRLFQQHLGVPPSRHYVTIRLAHARRLLVQTSMKVSEVALATGFASASHLAGCFGKAYGMSPRQYRSRSL